MWGRKSHISHVWRKTNEPFWENNENQNNTKNALKE